MSTKIGNLDLVGVRFGSDEVTAIYAGTDLVYSSYNYKEKYLTLVPTTASSTFQFSQTGLSYSLDSGSTWTALEASTDTPSVGVGDKIMFKGTITPTSYGIGIFSSSSEFDAEGNIMSLLYGDNFIGETSLSGKSYAFYYLFRQSSVVSAKNLVLLATTLAEGCYYSMFAGCTSLTVAPELPATTLADYCYSSMFWGCTSLTTVPSNMLQATTLATSCYSSMFRNCTSLTTAPELIATTLANQCYEHMFDGCIGLTVAPQLQATTLSMSCYAYMFKDCTSLTEAPQLPSTTLADSCYFGMFYGCSSLTKAPELLTDTLANYCYGYMFQGCTSLTVAPILSATTLVNSCYSGMFNGCTSLTAITCLATDISASYCTYYWVNGVAASGTFTKANEMSGWTIDSVNGVPSGWTVQDITLPYDKQYFTLVPISAASTFQFSNAGLSYSLDNGSTWTALAASTNTPSVAAGDKILFKGTITPNSSSGIGTFSSSDKFDVQGNAMSLLYGDNFIGQTSLSGKDYALKGLFGSNTNVISAENMILPATTLSNFCYHQMFANCSSLTTSPVLSATTLAQACYEDMFIYCYALTTAPELPATTLAIRCYKGMFFGCNGLTTAPILPATALTSECYRYMFYQCSRLNTITCLATSGVGGSNTGQWTQSVSSSGTFYKNPNMTSWTRGTSGIPNNWTVLDYSE